jgi:hypothetical protein
VTPDGRQVWGRPDVAFATGPGPAGTPPLLSSAREPDRGCGRGTDLPDSLAVGGERMDLGYVVGVLLGNRDLGRRPAAGRSGPRGDGEAA